MIFRKSNPKAQLTVLYEPSPLFENDSVDNDGIVSHKLSDYESVIQGLPKYTEFTLEQQLAAGVPLQEVNSIIIGGQNDATIISDSDVDSFSDHLEENVIIPN